MDFSSIEYFATLMVLLGLIFFTNHIRLFFARPYRSESEPESNVSNSGGVRYFDEHSAPWKNPIETGKSHYVFEDKYPVTPGHLLFVPRSNSVMDVTIAYQQATLWGAEMLNQKRCTGYNIGLNQGTSAGQTIDWPHVHLILRHDGDCADPVGGIRNVIPGQGNYKKDTYKQPLS